MGVRVIESPIWIAEAVAAEATALVAEIFREAPAHEAAARLVAEADPGAEALPVQVVHEGHQAWEAEVVAAVAASVVVVGADDAAAAAVVDGRAKTMKAPKEISEAKNESTT